MTKKIITISRQYGSGGREVGELVAKELGYAYYDKQLIQRIAQTEDIDPDFVNVNGEGFLGKITAALSHGILGATVGEGQDEDSLPLSDRLFLIQGRTVKKIAQEGPCVIIGHSADYFLDGWDNVLSAYIVGDMESRIGRVMRRNSLDRSAAMQRIKKINNNRKAFYEAYTERKWGKADNYHVTLDSSYFGIEQTAQILIDIARMDDYKKPHA
jgi:cytidylate kinase